MTEQTSPKECLSCGVQLNSDGSVDALPEDENQGHYADCVAPTADQIEAGQRWHIASRDIDAIVVSKFVGADGATYVRLQWVGHPDQEMFNWPWQLRPAQCIGRRRSGPGKTEQCSKTATPGTEYCTVCER